MAYITIDEQNAINDEVSEINAVMEFIESTGLPSQDEIMEEITSLFSTNGKTILKSSGTPLYILLQAIALRDQINAGLMKEAVCRLLYTQASGEDLSLAAANYGYERIEAKASTMSIDIITTKAVTLSAGTSFTDGSGNIWLSDDDVTTEAGVATRVALTASEKGIVQYISPLNSTNPIANLDSISVVENSIVVGREQESDQELKDTISAGISVFGSDDSAKRALLQLSSVNSAFVRTNPYFEDTTYQDIIINGGMRYTSLRMGSSVVSNDEADLVAGALTENTIYGTRFQKPNDKYVKYYFGISEELLTADEADGGAGLLGQSDDSTWVLNRVTTTYGNYVDVYFQLATPTYINVLITIQFGGTYTSTEKENITGQVKKLVTQTISEVAQVGAQLLTSVIANKLLQNSDLVDKLTIQSLLLRKEGESVTTQALEASGNEYFTIYENASDAYAGIMITEE